MKVGQYCTAAVHCSALLGCKMGMELGWQLGTRQCKRVDSSILVFSVLNLWDINDSNNFFSFTFGLGSHLPKQ